MSRKGQPAISLGDVASSILDAKLPDGVGPILARRQSLERKIAEVQAEEREQVEVARAKRALRSQAHLTLRSSEVTTNPVLETMLKKVATKGVVALFNAVRTAQRDQQPDGGDAKLAKRRKLASASEEAPAAQSKDSFLDVIRRGTGAAAAQSGRAQQGRSAPGADDVGGVGAAGRASFLRDDFMLNRNRAKDWERAVDEDEDDLPEEEGRGVDFDDDL